MSDWTPEKIAMWRSIAAQGYRTQKAVASALPDALAEIARLRERLELDAFTDGAGKPVSNADGRLDAYDGISCRDETIKLQDAEIERLQAKRERREQLLRECLPVIDAYWPTVKMWNLTVRIRAELGEKP